jgi:NADH-quinone oxidoreductase subunit M
MSLSFILIPFVAAALLLLARPAATRQLALLATLANLAVTVYCFGCDYSQGMNCTFQAPWLPEAGISFSLGMDGVTLLMLLLTNLVSPLIIYGSWSRTYENEPRYYGLILLMIGALNGVFLATDGLLCYLGRSGSHPHYPEVLHIYLCWLPVHAALPVVRLSADTGRTFICME